MQHIIWQPVARAFDAIVACAGALRENMLRPLDEEGAAAGLGARPGTGMPRSPMEQVSCCSISTELGQSDWRISPYETNPPSEKDEGGGWPPTLTCLCKRLQT